MKKQKIIFICLLTVLIVSGVFFSFYVKSKISSIKSLRSSIAESQKDSLKTTEEDREGIRDIDKLIPPESNIAEFIENVYRVSKRRNIRNLLIEQKDRGFIELSSGRVLKTTPPSGQKSKVIYMYPVKIAFNSGYRDMAEFVREIQSQERLVSIENISVKRDKESLAVELLVNIYSVKEK